VQAKLTNKTKERRKINLRDMELLFW